MLVSILCLLHHGILIAMAIRRTCCIISIVAIGLPVETIVVRVVAIQLSIAVVVHDVRSDAVAHHGHHREDPSFDGE